MEGALGNRAVAEEDDHHVVPSLLAKALGHAHPDRKASTHDPVRPIDTALEVRDVHRPAHAATSTGDLAHQLGEHRSTSAPLARQFPWPRWFDTIPSVSRSGQQPPTAMASWPTDTCTRPGMVPAAYSSAVRSSNCLMRTIRR